MDRAGILVGSIVAAIAVILLGACGLQIGKARNKMKACTRPVTSIQPNSQSSVDVLRGSIRATFGCLFWTLAMAIVGVVALGVYWMLFI